MFVSSYGAVSVSVFLFLPGTLPESFAVTIGKWIGRVAALGGGSAPGPRRDWNWDGRQGSSRDAIDAAAIAWPHFTAGPGCCPTTTPGTPVAAVVGAAASPTVPVPVSVRVLAHLQAWQLDLSICQGCSHGK